MGTQGLAGQTLLADAAVAAGVQRFIPSEFGSDLANPLTAALPVFGYKLPVNAHLASLAAKNDQFTYTIIRNGAFLDWGLEHAFILNNKVADPKIYGDGNQEFPVTLMSSVADAVVGVLKHPAETANRAVDIQDMLLTQNKILAIAKQIEPEKAWAPQYESIETTKKTADAAIANGDYSFNVMVLYLFCSVFGPEYQRASSRTDNELLGLKGLQGEKGDKVIEEILRKTVGK